MDVVLAVDETEYMSNNRERVAYAGFYFYSQRLMRLEGSKTSQARKINMIGSSCGGVELNEWEGHRVKLYLKISRLSGHQRGATAPSCEWTNRHGDSKMVMKVVVGGRQLAL